MGTTLSMFTGGIAMTLFGIGGLIYFSLILGYLLKDFMYLSEPFILFTMLMAAYWVKLNIGLTKIF